MNDNYFVRLGKRGFVVGMLGSSAFQVSNYFNKNINRCVSGFYVKNNLLRVAFGNIPD